MRAIVFDFDGVIVDSEPLHELALLHAVNQMGMDFSSERYWSHYIGFDDRDAFRAICADNAKDPASLDYQLFCDLKKQNIEKAINRGEPATYPGVKELVNAAAEAGVPMAICSGARRHEIVPILRNHRLDGFFQTIVAADDVPRSKPDPTGYRMACERLGVEPRSCVAIEDTPTGAKAAWDAGMRVVAVCHSVSVTDFDNVSRIVEKIGDVTLDLLRGV
ncbi:MAG: HAD family phosphatase [Planctomycetota bacterium]|nr:HAD family phosphatase [Planctomycetota bacterium]